MSFNPALLSQGACSITGDLQSHENQGNKVLLTSYKPLATSHFSCATTRRDTLAAAVTARHDSPSKDCAGKLSNCASKQVPKLSTDQLNRMKCCKSTVGQPSAAGCWLSCSPQLEPLESRASDLGRLCAAVECRDLRYHVGRGKNKRAILQDINVTVPEGSIYGLLGPSGCGKTTMLRCLVGRLQPKSGSVRAFGYAPNEPGSRIPGSAIGYMPQEIAVQKYFNIKEALTYYGKIHGMKRDLIEARIEFLLNFLDLPEKDRIVEHLSGGQKRRVSLAAALVHSPPLLVLDEPTVGVDPLLRQSIWKHLVFLAQTEKITVIITTHYIEEARQANVVGLMRHGRLLTEDSPDNLMVQFGMKNLEDVFLKLCVSDSSRKAAKLANETSGRNKKHSQRSDRTRLGPVDGEAKFRVRGQQMVLDANGLPIERDSLGAKEFAGKRAQTPATLGRGHSNKAFQRGDHVATSDLSLSSDNESVELSQLDEDEQEAQAARVGFVVNKNSLRSMQPGSKYAPRKMLLSAWFASLRAVIWKNCIRIKRNPPLLLFEFLLPTVQLILFCLCIGGEPFDIPLAVVNDETIPFASKYFLEAIDKNTIRQIPYSNLSAAIESVRKGETWGAIHIPDRYTQSLQDRLINPSDASEDSMTNATISIYPDLTNLHLAIAMENTFRKAFIRFAKDTLTMFGYDPEAAELPIKVQQPVHGTLKRDGFLEFMAPGVVISMTYVMAAGLTALVFILEKRDGHLERSLVSGVTTTQVLLAHTAVQVVVMSMQISLVLTFKFFVFKIPSNGPFIWVILLILLQGCTGMGFGLLISALCEEENTAVMMLVGTFYTNLMLAGIIWPLAAMPRWLRWFSYIQPQTLATETLRNVLSRGWSISEPGVYLGFCMTIGWLVVFLVSAGLYMRYSK